MEQISFVIPCRNNLNFLKLAYKSLKQLGNNHYICLADDASTDGTWNWIQKKQKTNPYLLAIRNEGPDRLGHCILYDRIINELVTTKLFCIFHCDMYAAKDFDIGLLKHWQPETIVSGTRIEPPLHPAQSIKITKNFGVDYDNFNELEFNQFAKNKLKEYKDKITDGVFAPWLCETRLFKELGGHDPLFAPQSKEDSDIFNRLLLYGCDFVQSWESLVYHFTCRGSRRSENIYNDSHEWIAQNNRSARNFVRKWGSYVKHSETMRPIVLPKYWITCILKNCSSFSLYEVEPCCSIVYADNKLAINEYIESEQKNTLYNLKKKIRYIDKDKDINIDKDIKGHIIVTIDINKNNNYSLLYQLSDIINVNNNNNNLIGKFILDTYEVNIRSLDNCYENRLISVLPRVVISSLSSSYQSFLSPYPSSPTPLLSPSSSYCYYN